VAIHTATKNKIMRTKTLLIAISALAAGLFSSQAQVTSINVVGYANISTPNGGTYLIDVPFQIGVSNGANEIWPITGGNPALPDGSEISTWNGSGYVNYFSDSTSSSGWDDGNQSPIPNAPLLPVGKGFFLIPAGDTTNQFLGSVAVNIGTSNKMLLANGGTYLVAPVVPYSGAVTNGNPVTGAGGANLSLAGGLPDGSELSLWNGSGYVNYFSDSGSSSGWDDGNQSPISTPPTISVGQGFFIIPAGDFPWTVGL
jgi:hypothetical protein